MRALGWGRGGQHSPSGAAGAILQQSDTPPPPGKAGGREPLLPSSLGLQTDWQRSHFPRKKALCVFGSSDSHSSQMEGLLTPMEVERTQISSPSSPPRPLQEEASV